MSYIIGIDALAGVHYPRAVLNGTDKGQIVCIFLRTFNIVDNVKYVITQWAKSNKFSMIIVHTAKFDTTHAYKITDAQLKELYQDASWLHKLSSQTKTKIGISPFCEHNHFRKVMEPIFNRLEEIAPNCTLVNSIWKGEEIPNTLTDIHIEKRSRLPKIPKNEFTVSFDGFGGDKNDPKRVNFTDTDVQSIIEHYEKSGRLHSVRAWNFRCNGKYSHLDVTPIGKRKMFPDKHCIRGYIYTLSKREGGEWLKDKLYKTFADDHGVDLSKPVNRSKDLKILFILPIDDATIEIKTKDGKRVATANKHPDAHTGTPKGNRYYLSMYMSQLADIVYKHSKSYLIQIKDYPLIDCRLRSGLFKD